MASITKILPSSIFPSLRGFTQQPLSVKFTDYFHRLKAHAPALTNRTIWIVAGATALSLFIIYKLTRGKGGSKKPSPKLEHTPPPPVETIQNHALFINQHRLKVEKENAIYKNAMPKSSDVIAFLRDEVVPCFQALVDDVKVGEKFSDKFIKVIKYIDAINNLIEELKTKKDENFDAAALKKVQEHLATAVKTLTGLEACFPLPAV